MPESAGSKSDWRAVVTWTSDITQYHTCLTEHEANEKVGRWIRLNPGDVKDVAVERRVAVWQRVGYGR